MKKIGKYYVKIGEFSDLWKGEYRESGTTKARVDYVEFGSDG